MDFLLLRDAIMRRQPDARVDMLCRRMEPGAAGALRYGVHILTQMRCIARSRVCVIDSYIIPVSVLRHKRALKVFQIWHAVGSVKKIGYQAVGSNAGRSETIARRMNMHEHYDRVLSGSEAMRQVFAEAFRVSPEAVKVACPPKIEYLSTHTDEVRERIYRVYPSLKNKENILYAPTYRRNKGYRIDELIDNIDYSRYNLIIKGHPVKEIDTDDSRVLECGEFSAFELITVADHVISDYSALAIEAAALDRRVYLYTYDYDEYVSELGLNIDITAELAGCVFEQIAPLMAKIDSKDYDFEQLARFRDKYVARPIAGTADELGDFILNL